MDKQRRSDYHHWLGANISKSVLLLPLHWIFPSFCYKYLNTYNFHVNCSQHLFGRKPTMANIDRQHEIVKSSLSAFVNNHISGADLSVVDEIVLSYVISILEEASQDPCFDVEGTVFYNLLLFYQIIVKHFRKSRIHRNDVCLHSGFFGHRPGHDLLVDFPAGERTVRCQQGSQRA